MRAGTFSSGKARLHEAEQLFKQSWTVVQEHWQDEAARTFEENMVLPILQQVADTIEAATQMSEVVFGAHRQCEDKDRM